MAVDTPIIGEPSEVRVPPRFDLLAAVGTGQGAKATSHYERSHIRVAKAGDAVAMMRQGDAREVLGRNTLLAEDGVTIRAAIAGCLLLEDGKVCIDSTLTITGDIDFSVGNVEFDGDVIVHGNVLDLFKVYSAGSVTVDGDVEAAEIHAGRDLRVVGSIVGKDRGAIVTGGSVHAKYITNGNVQAAGNIVCAVAVTNSQLICGGRVEVKRGAIAAGNVIACGGVACKTLGNSAGVLTVIEVGVDEVFRRELPGALAAIDAKRQKAKKIEQIVQPLLQHQKTLTPAQKEKATELLFEAQQMTQEAVQATAALKERHASMIHLASTKAEIVVAGTLYPGVVIRFPALQTRIMSAIRGPVRIAIKAEDPDHRIMATDLINHTTHPLGCESIHDRVAMSLIRIPH
jgi:uncharacterized protein (DUF342 family)